jgi:hypothetical protein
MEGFSIESKQRTRARQFREFARHVSTVKTRNADNNKRIRKTSITKVEKRLI